jgi:hypothetical protein
VPGSPRSCSRRPSSSGIAGVLQSTTSLPFVVAATEIGQDLGVVSRASAAVLVAAGLLSVVISPALGSVHVIESEETIVVSAGVTRPSSARSSRGRRR